jgi:hypothetical protein
LQEEETDEIRFQVQYRNLVNDEGVRVTYESIDAIYTGNETTFFSNSLIVTYDWLYLYIEEAGEDTEVLTVTVTVTCITV